MTTSPPEVTTNGLVLWRMRRSPEEQLWCSVRDHADELALIFQDPSTPGATVAERHSHIGPLVDRATHMRDQLSAAGWTVVDVDFDEPD